MSKKFCLPNIFLLTVVLIFSTLQVNACTFTVNAGTAVTVCANQTIVLNASVTPANGNYTYQWSSATGIIYNSTVLNSLVRPDTPGEYIISVTSGGCTVVDSVLITV